jgi:hypothetical protein
MLKIPHLHVICKSGIFCFTVLRTAFNRTESGDIRPAATNNQPSLGDTDIRPAAPNNQPSLGGSRPQANLNLPFSLKHLENLQFSLSKLQQPRSIVATKLRPHPLKAGLQILPCSKRICKIRLTKAKYRIYM